MLASVCFRIRYGVARREGEEVRSDFRVDLFRTHRKKRVRVNIAFG